MSRAGLKFDCLPASASLLLVASCILVVTGCISEERATTQVPETEQAMRGLGLQSSNSIGVLPEAELGERTWGIACLSVASARELPNHKAEMAMQVLMGRIVRVLQRGTNAMWYYIQSEGGYYAWLERGTFARCSQPEAEAWTNSALLFITAMEEVIWSKPDRASEPVSDVVLADLVKKTGEPGEWYEVELPDKRTGFLPKTAAEDYVGWRAKRRPSPENIEHTARRFLGRPYLWGGDSPKGFDCSGFTHLVFFLNGIELSRNSSQQAKQGLDVPLDANLSRLSKGDLLFFGAPARGDKPEGIHHVGIYLGDKLFIHSQSASRLTAWIRPRPFGMSTGFGRCCAREECCRSVVTTACPPSLTKSCCKSPMRTPKGRDPKAEIRIHRHWEGFFRISGFGLASAFGDSAFGFRYKTRLLQPALAN